MPDNGKAIPASRPEADQDIGFTHTELLDLIAASILVETPPPDAFSVADLRKRLNGAHAVNWCKAYLDSLVREGKLQKGEFVVNGRKKTMYFAGGA